MRAALQGLGVVGGFGCGKTALQTALENGKPALQSVSVRTAGGMLDMPVFLADTSGLEKYVNKKALRRIDHYAKLALLGSYLTLDDAGQLEIDHRPRMGIIIASGYGAMRTTFSFLDSFLEAGDKFSSPIHFSSSVHNAAVAYVSMFLGLTGPGLTVSQFEMSVPSGLLAAWNWLEQGRVDSVLFGAVDEYCEVLGYCWQRFFGDWRKGAEDFDPMKFQKETALPGEGASFFLLTREDDTPHPRYGFLEKVRLGRGEMERTQIPEDSLLFLGADGHKKCGEFYKPFLSNQAPGVSYAALYGSFPAAPAFDLAVAALSVKNQRFYPPPVFPSGTSGAERIYQAQDLDNRRICCLKTGGEGEWSSIILNPR